MHVVTELRQALSGALLRVSPAANATAGAFVQVARQEQRGGMQAERADREVAELLAALRSTASAVEEGVAQSLTLVGALSRVADRIGDAELAHLLEPRVARQLDLLQGQLRHYLTGLLDVLWQIRRLPQLVRPVRLSASAFAGLPAPHKVLPLQAGHLD